MVKPASGRSKDELMQAFGSCLQRGDVMGALEPGIEIVDKFGASNVDQGLLATLPNLLMHRDAPGDAERAYVMCAALMSDFPPAMRERRHQITYDYVQALVRTKQFAKAFETCDAINPPTARDAAEARELRFESLANLRACLERENTYHATQDPSNLELAVAVSRELLKLRDGAHEHLNLGASLCIKGDLEEGVRHYEIAAGKQDEPESRGGLNAAAKERLRKNIANGRAQLAGNMPREGRFTTPTILSGAALQMNFAPDGSMIGEPTVVRAPPPTRAEDE